MNRLTPTSRVIGCPLCSKTNGNCRISDNDQLVLCMTNAGGMLQFTSRYKYIGDTKDSLWGKFIRQDGDYTSKQQQAYQQYKEVAEKAAKEAHMVSLPVVERDRNIRKISQHLGLTEGDRQKLKERGLSDEEIIKGGFFSIRPFNKLPVEISTRLAGVYIGREGYPTIGSDFQQGIACPTFTKDGWIAGYQIRRDDQNNKYIWAVTSAKGSRPKISSHLKNGELPLTYHGKGKDTLFLIEGILKPFIAHCRHDLDVLGAAGGNFVSSPEQLLDIVKQYKYIYIVPDGGDILNRSVMRRIKRTHDFLEQHDIKLQVAWYGQITKDDGDIDEIESFEYDILDFDQFEELANKEQFQAKKRARLVEHKQFTPDITIEERYLSDFMEKIKFQGKITALRSSKNTGKSFYLKELARKSNKAILLLGDRVILTRKLSDTMGMEFIDPNTNIEQVEIFFDNQDLKKRRLGIVIDSLLKAKNIDWSDVLVVIDEAEQVTQSLLLGKTHIRSVRGQVLAMLAKKLPQVCGIILSDADLSDFTVNYYSMISKLQHQKILNTYQENDRTLHRYPSHEEIINNLDANIGLGDICAVVCDSSKELTALQKIYQEKGIKSVLITRDSLADDPSLHRYIANNGQLIKSEGIQVLLMSPVCQSGVSLEIDDYFDKYFGIFHGVVATGTARQMLIRDRGKCARHVWAADRSFDYSTDYDYQQVLKNQEFRDQALLESIHYWQELENMNFGQAMDKVRSLMTNNREIRDFNAECAARLIAVRNIECSDYAAILFDDLEAEGYQISDYSPDLPISGGGVHELKQVKEDQLNERAEKVYAAPLITEAEATILDKKPSLKQTERDKLLRFKIEQALPEFPLSPSFIAQYILKDNFQKINAVKNLYLAEHPEIAKKLDFNAINYNIGQVLKGGLYWTRDTNSKMILANLYGDLKIKELINSELTTKVIEDFIKRCQPHRQALGSLGIKWGKNTYKIKLIQKILKLWGYKTVCAKAVQGKRCYGITPLADDMHNAIYDSIKLKYSQELLIKKEVLEEISLKASETKSEQGLYLGAEPINTIKINPGSAPKSNFYPEKVTLPNSRNLQINQENDNFKPEISNLVGKLVYAPIAVKENWFLGVVISQENEQLTIDFGDNGQHTCDASEVAEIEEGARVNFLTLAGDWVKGIIAEVQAHGLKCLSSIGEALWCSFGQVTLAT